MRLIFLPFIASLVYTSSIQRNCWGSEAQQDKLTSFAASLIKFVKPIRDDSLPSFAFFIQNDLPFYVLYRTILDTRIHDPNTISSIYPIRGPKMPGVPSKNSRITVRKAFVYYGIEGVFNILGEEPIIKEIFLAVKRKCQEECDAFQNKLATLEQAKIQGKSKL